MHFSAMTAVKRTTAYTDPSKHGYCIGIILFILFCPFLITTPNENGSADFDDHYVKRRGLMQEKCLLRIITITFLFGRVMPKTPHFGAGIGISSLNVESNNF
jgi:hypothetical protein